ncbi:hypothetical protein PS15m_003640 [Mucor circinelloides]
MTELFVTKAVVKLPKKTNANRLSHHLIVDTSSDYNMATNVTTATNPHQQVSPISEEYYSNFLVTEKLYIDGLPNSVIETEIMDLVKSCCPERIYLNRNHEVASGYIQFKSKEMADRAYTLLNGVTFRAGLRLQLKINPPSSDCPEPEAHAGILHIKNLPGHTNNKLLYELFRPFGPMILCKILVEQASTFKGTALVQYFNPQDAQDAESMMNNKTVQGNTISVFPIIPNSSKPTKSSAHSIETKDITLNTADTISTHISTPTSPLPPTPAPMNTASPPTSVIRSDGSSMVDYTNLYIKNLDLNVKSVDLFNNFRRFGRIISARVMKNAQTKQSKGFGFVSFSKTDEAQKAKHEMNGEFILSKPVIVAFHEPKKAREADVNVSPTQSTFNGASRQQIATSVSPHLVQHQQQHQHQYNRLSPPPPPTPSFTSSPSHQNLYEQQQQKYQQQQSNGSGYHGNSSSNNSKNNARTRDSIDQRYGSNVTMPQLKYNNNNNSYQQTYTPSPPPPPPSNGIKTSYQPMERNSSNLSHHHPHQSMPAANQHDQRQQQQTNQYQGFSKKGYEPYQQQHTYNTPIRRIPSATGSVQQPPSLSTLASGVFINTNATTPTSASTNNTYQPPNYISPPPPQYRNVNNHWSYSPHSQKQQQQQERPSFRRRGSVESMVSVMTETSSQTRRQTITKAVLAVEKDNDSNLNDIVDMLLTLRKKDLATCLFNKVFLKAKIKQAKDALDIFVEEQQQHQHPPSHKNLTFHEPVLHIASTPPASTMVTNYYYQPKEELTPSYLQNVALPPKGSRAIPIIAPPPPSTTPSPVAARNTSPPNTGPAHNATTTKTASATNGAGTAATAAVPSSSNNKPTISTDSKVLDSDTMNAQELGEEISKFLKSLDGLPLHEKKQSLGDRLFPLVKSTGVKQAPKITIRLLDSVPLDELAYSMYDKDKLKHQVTQISATISTKY